MVEVEERQQAEAGPTQVQVTQAPVLAQPQSQLQQQISTQAQSFVLVNTSAPGPYPPQPQQAPIDCIYAQLPQGQQQQQQHPWFQMAPRGRGSPGMRGRQGRSFATAGIYGECWQCGQKRPMWRDCPMNPQGGQGPPGQMQQNAPRGPANHWTGPNAGY